jgi:hypothetical protein
MTGEILKRNVCGLRHGYLVLGHACIGWIGGSGPKNYEAMAPDKPFFLLARFI